MRTQSRAELETLMDALSQYIDNSVEVIDEGEASKHDQIMFRMATNMLARVEVEFVGDWS